MHGLLNRKFLEGIGVELDEQTFDALSEHYERTLNERVMAEIVDGLDEDQLEALHSLEGGETDLLCAWLVANVPQLDEIIEDEVAILLGEIAESSDQI